MSVQLHRAALWLRLFLVCLVLTGVSVPARTMDYREAVVAVATVTARATESRAVTPARAATPAARSTRPAVTSRPAALVAVAPRRAPAPPRRLYLIHSALLC